ILLQSAMGTQVVTRTASGEYVPLSYREPLRRAVYMSGPEPDDLSVQSQSRALSTDMVPLLALLGTSGNGEAVSARVFVPPLIRDATSEGQTWKKYFTPSQTGYSWNTDAQQGRLGWFLTGQTSRSALWKVLRLEHDLTGAPLFTLRSHDAPRDTPAIAPSRVTDPEVRDRLDRDIKSIGAALVSHAYQHVVTGVRTVAEALIREVVRGAGLAVGRDLFEDLKTIKQERDRTGGELQWCSDLAYHLAHKVRLLHARTHIPPATTGRTVFTASLAYSIVEDLSCLIRELGFAT
ncbi:MAG: hypothetical protein AABY13_00005, partial [Nanoarchaeota archaeon]